MPLALATRIVRAVIYSDCAHVVRSAQLELQSGAQGLEILDLPVELRVEDLRVSVDRGALQSIELDDHPRQLDESSPDAIRRAHIRLLERKVGRLLGEKEGLEAELQLINALSPKISRNGPKESSSLRPDLFVQGLELVSQRQRRTNRRLRKVARAMDRLSERLESETSHLELLGRTERSGERRSNLRVCITTEEAGPCNLEVSYLAGWASWRPYYHLRLDSVSGAIVCQRFADLWQETGEDWSEVELQLSTAEPESALALPLARPWLIGSKHAFNDRGSELYRSRDGRRASQRELNLNESGTSASERDRQLEDFRAYARQFEADGAYQDHTCAGVMRGGRAR